MEIGENVAILRNRQGMTQRDLAEALNVTPSMIAQIERGTKCLTMQLAAKMAVVLECQVEDFIAAGC